MDSVSVLICSEDILWRERLRQAIDCHCDCKCGIREKPGDPGIADLSVNEEQQPIGHPPDVVVWHIRETADARCPVRIWDWAPGTRFVVVDSSGRLPPIGSPSPPPVPFAVLPPSAASEDIAEAVEAAASSCWWRQLCELDMPACQISSGGRILRMNPCMRDHFAGTVDGTERAPFFFDLFPPRTGAGWCVHPTIDRVLDSKKARAEFVETGLGQMQFVCLPDLFQSREVRTVSVLMPDTGRRARVLQFANDPEEKGSLAEIHRFVINCAIQLGYQRARLYRYDLASESFRGVASHGFVDPNRRTHFETEFAMRIADDAPSRDILETRLASLCVHDPDGKHVNKACTLVRVYTGQPHRNYEQELELQGANRWVEAPLVVPGTNEVIGKIVVDNGVHSDVLNVRDALDVGFLAMMAAGAIYAFQMAEERRALIRNAELLNEIYSFLPRVVLERNDQRFYRVIAALLSCDPGLQWEQVLLFIADSTGLMQAECAMALGGIDPSVRERIKRACTRLRDYVDLALNEVRGPQGDALFERWVEFGSEEQRINFGSDVQDRGAIAEALGRPTELPWREIDVTEDPWCRKLNADDQFFLGKRVFAFPLTRSFAVDSAIDTQSTPTQPVGVAVVGMITEGREVEEQRLVFTRVVLDLFGPLIAQRWTNQRMSGLYGSLYRINHADLVSTWNAMPSVRQNIEVLVVDNRRDHLEEWCSALRVIPDCHVRTAESFEDAVDQLQEEAVDLLITDLFLTRESEVRERLAEAEGLDLIEQCRLRYPDSRIIAITSLVGNGDAGAEAMVRGADDFISSQWLDVYAKALLEQKAKIFRSLLLRDRRKGNTANVK